ncbi:MAG: MFS transporter [Sporomusa sp.]
MNIRGVEISKTQVGVFLMVWTIYMLSFTERLALPPVLPLIAKDLELTGAQAGSYMTAFYIGYVFTQLPGGLLTDRFGYRKVLMGSLLAIGAATALMYMVTSYEMGFLFRMLAGVGSGSVFSASMRAIFEWFPGKGRGTAVGILQTATSFGLMFANLMVPYVASQHDWRFAFLVTGILPLFVLALAWLFLKERNTAVERAAKRQAQPAEFWQDVLSLTKNRNLMVLALAGFFAMAATWGTATWANTYMNKSMNVSLVMAGALMSTYGIAGIVCKPFSGLLSDIFYNKKKYLICIMQFCFVVPLLWFGSNSNVQLLYILVPLLGTFAFIYSPVMNTLIGELVPLRLAGTAAGFVNACWQLGSLFAPYAIGHALDISGNNYFYAFAMLAIFAFCSGVTILFINQSTIAKET